MAGARIRGFKERAGARRVGGDESRSKEEMM